jgi:hypothetical protein
MLRLPIAMYMRSQASTGPCRSFNTAKPRTNSRFLGGAGSEATRDEIYRID